MGLKKKFFFLIFLCALFVIGCCYAQEKKPKSGFSVGLRGHYGFIIPHSESIAEQAFSNPRSAEISLSWQLARESIYETFGTHPRVGLSVSLIDFDNTEVLGQGLGLVPYFEPSLIGKPRFDLSFAFGAGPVFLTRVFDPQSNPDNLFYSSPLSFLLFANLNMRLRLSERWLASISGSYNHISNGGLRLPNKGINFPTASIGLEYCLRTPYFGEGIRKDWRSLHQRRSWWTLNAFATAVTVAEGDSRRYLVTGFAALRKRVVGRLSALTAGAEWIADFADLERAKRNGQSLSPHRISLLAGHEFLLGRFRFSQTLGFYVLDPGNTGAKVYQRYGLDFYMNSKWSTGFHLKSYGDVADFMDLRLSYSF